MARLALAAALLTLTGVARAQEYRPPAHAAADEVALGLLIGRFVSPVSCTRADGTSFDTEEAIAFKSAPESGGGRALKLTFFGIEARDAAYCFSGIERRVVDRRGVLYLHFRAHNRPDRGIADFRRMAQDGPLPYNTHRGELVVRGLGSENAAEPARTLSFEGEDSMLLLRTIQSVSDGARLLAPYDAKVPRDPERARVRRRFAFEFTAVDGKGFTFYGIESGREWR